MGQVTNWYFGSEKREMKPCFEDRNWVKRKIFRINERIDY